MRDIIFDLDNGLKKYYEDANAETMMRSADRELKKLEEQLCDINCKIAIARDSLRLNASYLRYLKGFSNQDIFKFNSNWYAWRNNSLRSTRKINTDKSQDTKNEVSKEYMQYTQKFFLDALFGRDRIFNVSLYHANHMGWEAYEVMFYFHIGNKFTMEIMIPNPELCHESKDVGKFDRFKCKVSVARALYNKDTNYYEYKFQRDGYDLNLLINEAFKFMGIEIGADVKVSDQCLTHYKQFNVVTIKDKNE